MHATAPLVIVTLNRMSQLTAAKATGSCSFPHESGNRALKPVHMDVVFAVVDGEFTCKHLWLRNGRIKLVPANATFTEISPKDGQTVEIWGVVTASIKRFRQSPPPRPSRGR